MSKCQVYDKLLSFFFLYVIHHFIIIIILYFFHCHLVSLYPHPSEITTLLSTFMSPFSFLLNPSPSNLPLTSCPLLSTYDSVSFCLLVQFVY